MKLLPLTQGKFAKVDDDFVSDCKWSYTHGYAKRCVKVPGTRKNINIYLHREVMQAQPGHHVDHINGDSLDNRMCNLRVCTHKENLRGFRKLKGQYRGVHHEVSAKRYVARIGVNDKTLHIGSFRTAEAAARAYDAAATLHFGEFAQRNFE